MRREKDDWTFLWRVTGPGGAWAAVIAAKRSDVAERTARRLGGAGGMATLIGVAVYGISPGDVILTSGLEPEQTDGRQRDST
jgi:hypothetical protein